MFEVKDLIARSLSEDIGGGDVTCKALLRQRRVINGKIMAKEPFVLAGIDVVRDVFTVLDESIIFRANKKDGDKVDSGTALAELAGDASSILMAERTALNFLQHLSGIATLTSSFVEKIRGSKAKVVDTRKTTPGLRSLEKYAVKVGGGSNHRTGLYDGILIKENHITACGGIGEAIRRAMSAAPHTLKVEVEVTNLDEVKEALEAEADIIMLDNMEIETMREAVRVISGKALVEASGNISLENISEVAFTGVDIISVGAITHSAPAVDVSMKVEMK